MDVSTAFAEFRRGRAGLIGPDQLYQLVQDPLWYQKFHRMSQARKLGTMSVALTHGVMPRDALRTARNRMVVMMSSLLVHDEVALGQPGQGLYEFDSERSPILDTFVFHHSGRPHGITLEELDALELLRLYVPTFKAPESDEDKERLRNKPIYSGHFQNGRQHFYPYHWLIKQDGRAIRLLEDHEIGWHAGKWEINKRSIGICFDDDLSHKAPNEKMLETARQLIHERYAWMHPSAANVHGHFKYTDTKCPGDQFENGVKWKCRLV